MGQLRHDLFIQHFSHPHTLELSNTQTNTPTPSAALTPSICAACKLPSSGWMYTCKQCIATFTLHASCSQMPALITHPSHTKHALTLLAKPAYSAGFFYCDACGRQGNGFGYHCAECEFDVHATCASKPLSAVHHMHCHQLQMEFFPPYNSSGFSCDICRSTGANHWLYRCAYCEFDAHLDCVTSTAQAQPQPQPQQLQLQPQPQPQPQFQAQRPQVVQQQWPQQVQNQARPQVPAWPQQQPQVQTWPQQQPQVQTWPQQQPQVQTGPQQQQQQVQTWPQQQQQQLQQAQPPVQQQVQTWPHQQQVQTVQPQLQVPQNYPQSGGADQYQYQNSAFANNNQPQGMNCNMPNSTTGPVQNQQNGQPGQADNNSLASRAFQTLVKATANQAGQMLVQNLLSGDGGGNGGSDADGGGVGVGSGGGESCSAGGEDSSTGGLSFLSSTCGGGDSGDCDLN